MRMMNVYLMINALYIVTELAVRSTGNTGNLKVLGIFRNSRDSEIYKILNAKMNFNTL